MLSGVKGEACQASLQRSRLPEAVPADATSVAEPALQKGRMMWQARQTCTYQRPVSIWHLAASQALQVGFCRGGRGQRGLHDCSFDQCALSMQCLAWYYNEPCNGRLVWLSSLRCSCLQKSVYTTGVLLCRLLT